MTGDFSLLFHFQLAPNVSPGNTPTHPCSYLTRTPQMATTDLPVSVPYVQANPPYRRHWNDSLLPIIVTLNWGAIPPRGRLAVSGDISGGRVAGG